MSSSNNSNDDDFLLQSLQETTQKTESSLLECIQNHVTSGYSSHGLDFLDTKNTLLLSYLIDLTFYLRGKMMMNDDANQEATLERLHEMKVVLEKTRGLEKKLKYQIDKLLAASSTSFASVEDPLQFRPNAAALDDDASSSSDDDREQRGSDDDEDDSDQEEDPDNFASNNNNDDDDADLAAARMTLALSKEKRVDRNEEESNIYKAPRLAAVPYTHDKVDRDKEREKRQRRRMRASEVAQTLRAQFDEAPEQEDLHGGAELGFQREAAQRVAQRAADKEKHEEDNFVRLVTKRTERKERERVLRQETSNLSAISDLGNIIRGVAAFDDEERGGKNRGGGRSNNNDQDDPWSKDRHANGKRRKQEMDSDGRAVRNKKTKFQAKNALQSELFTKPKHGGNNNKHGKNKHQNRR